jgi:hypothetical protein
VKALADKQSDFLAFASFDYGTLITSAFPCNDEPTQTKTSICPSFGGDETVMPDPLSQSTLILRDDWETATD